MHSLFDVPSAAGDYNIPGGGFGAGGFTFQANGRFDDWRFDPGIPARRSDVPGNRFHLWAGDRAGSYACTVQPGSNQACPWGSPVAASRRRSLFPCSWTEYDLVAMPLRGATCVFSPLFPGGDFEASLPLMLVVWRVANASHEPIEAALMLTWAAAWPEPEPVSLFDFQHDRLCLTGSLGARGSSIRQGIALPDLHYAGIYQIGIEPWDASGDGVATWQDFAEDGELDPSISRCERQGAAAWVKFELDPGEVKEIPFIVAWHVPDYTSGPFASSFRRYVRHLGRHRPENAVVWLAEQAVQDFGTEYASYRHWMRRIQDWHEGAGPPGADPRTPGALWRANAWWTHDGLAAAAAASGQSEAELGHAIAAAGLLWPDLGHALAR